MRHQMTLVTRPSSLTLLEWTLGVEVVERRFCLSAQSFAAHDTGCCGVHRPEAVLATTVALAGL